MKKANVYWDSEYNCRIEGDVHIGHGCVIHPTCWIIAESGGSIRIGTNNIFEEKCVIRYLFI